MTVIDKATAAPELALIGSMSVWHWLIVLVVVLLLFGGGGKIPRLMKDLGTGVRSFKGGLKDEDKDKGEAKAEEAGDSSKAIEGEATTKSSQTTDKTTASS